MLKSQKLAIAASVAVVFSGQSFAIVDGWDFSGSSARNEAMNLDYWNSRDNDNYNVWVNPAYVTEYKNYVDINITDGSRDDEMAGVFYESASAGTWGFYIGRPAAPADDFEIPVGAPFIEEPRSQFDLFWGMGAGAAGEFGVRLNVQLLEGDFTNSPTSLTNPNTPQQDDLFRTVDTTNTDSGDFDSSDINLSLGWVSNSGQFDAALLIGSPSRSSSDAFSDEFINETLNGIDRTVTGRSRNTSSETNSADDDGQQNLGLVFRADFGILTTLSYAKRDYSMKSASSNVFTNQFDNNGDGVFNTDTTTITTTNGAFDGESTEIRLVGSQVFPVTATSNIFGSLGIVSFESETTDVTTVVASSTTDNVLGETTYGDLGIQNDVYRKNTNLEIPLVVSAEGKVSDSFTIRGSVIKNLYETEEFERTTRTYERPTTPDGDDTTTATQNILVQTESFKRTRTWDTDTTIALGLGYTKASFTLDLVILKEFVTQGVDDPLTSRINGTWKF